MFGLRRQIRRGGWGIEVRTAGGQIRRGSDCARALPRASGGRCGVWGLGKPIRPRFALASMGASRDDGKPLKEMTPEDSGGMAGWSEA